MPFFFFFVERVIISIEYDLSEWPLVYFALECPLKVTFLVFILREILIAVTLSNSGKTCQTTAQGVTDDSPVLELKPTKI